MEQLLPYVGMFLAGAAGAKFIDWLRFHKVDQATAAKHNADAHAAIHNSDTNAVSMTSGLLTMWMTNASDANAKIIELSSKLAQCRCEADK